MPKKAASPNMEFAVAQLRKNPRMSFAALRTAAHKRGLEIVPIVYGRAKLALGLTGGESKSPDGAPARRERSRASSSPGMSTGVMAPAPVTPEGPPPAAPLAQGSAPSASPPRRRGRPPRAAAPTMNGTGSHSNGGLDLAQLVEAVRVAEAQRDALEKIQAILDRLGIHARSQAPAPRRRRGRPPKAKTTS